MTVIGCHNCKWSVGHYCERPGGNDCGWEKEVFGRGSASWSGWAARTPKPLAKDAATAILMVLAENKERLAELVTRKAT